MKRRSLITAMTGLVVVAAAASFAVTVAPAAFAVNSFAVTTN